MSSLIIIAGPNGAGKSTSSQKILEPFGISAFDFDYIFYREWSKFNFEPSVEEGVRSGTIKKFSNHLEAAFLQKAPVSFETNFNNDLTLKHVEKAKKLGYETRLYFIGLESVELAIKRVKSRVDSGGHFVSQSTIKERYHDGLELLDKAYSRFDRVFIFESPPNYKPIVKCLVIDKSGVNTYNEPSFLNHLPNLKQQVVRGQ